MFCFVAEFLKIIIIVATGKLCNIRQVRLSDYDKVYTKYMHINNKINLVVVAAT